MSKTDDESRRQFQRRMRMGDVIVLEDTETGQKLEVTYTGGWDAKVHYASPGMEGLQLSPETVFMLNGKQYKINLSQLPNGFLRVEIEAPTEEEVLFLEKSPEKIF